MLCNTVLYHIIPDCSILYQTILCHTHLTGKWGLLIHRNTRVTVRGIPDASCVARLQAATIKAVLIVKVIRVPTECFWLEIGDWTGIEHQLAHFFPNSLFRENNDMCCTCVLLFGFGFAWVSIRKLPGRWVNALSRLLLIGWLAVSRHPSTFGWLIESW